MDTLKRMTGAAHYGMKAKVADKVERPLAKRLPLSLDTLRALVGGVFLLLSVRRVYRAVRAGLR